MAVPAPSSQQMKFTKSEAEYHMTSIRFLLLTITSTFIIIAGLMIIFGISVYTYYHSFSFFYESTLNGKFFTPSILCILVGTALMVVTLFGFFGSLKQSTCMVNTYAVILSVILIIKLVVIILAFTADPQTFMDYLYIPVQDYTSDPEIQAEIDRLQVLANCCGSYSYRDYTGMDFDGNHSTLILKREYDGEVRTTIVPESRCISSDEFFCTELRNIGCKQALTLSAMHSTGVLGTLGVLIMSMILLGIIFAVLLARCIRKLKSEKALMSWKIKEQMILARENEASQKNADDKGIYIAHPESSVV